MAEPKQLLRSQANAVFEAIRSRGLDPSDFEWTEMAYHAPERTIPVLVHRPTGYHYEFDSFHYETFTDAGTEYIARFSPGHSDMVEESSVHGWEGLLSVVGEWLVYLKREIEAPNFWAAVSEEKKLIEASSQEEENRPFNQDELRYIGQQLTEIKEFLFKTQELSESHKQFVTDRLDYLADAAGRVGRVDWKNQLVGVLLGIAMQTALTSDATRELFRFAWTALGQLFGGTPALPH